VSKALLVVALALNLSAGATPQKQRKPATHAVTIDATSFQPVSITLAPGDTVTWTNKDVIPHTATSSRSGAFDSGTITPGKSWSHTFTTAGSLAYFCEFHPTMKGRVRVK